MNKFLGIGLKNLVILWIALAIITLMMKAITAKHPVKGLTPAVQAL